MKLSLLLLPIISACVSVTIAEEPTLESLQQVYQNQVEMIEAQHSNAQTRLLDDYGADLGKAIEVLKKEGDPYKALAGIAEKKRFDEKKGEVKRHIKEVICVMLR